MHIILIILYSVLLSVAVTRMPFIRKSGLRPSYVLIFFWFRIILSWIHNWMAYRYYPNHGDIWLYFDEGLYMKADLLKDPAVFLNRYIVHDIVAPDNELSFRLVSTINMLLDFLSFDNFYINSLLFSFLTFTGSIALYRVFMNAFSGARLCSLPVLLLPSALFWTACIHKDGWLYMMLGFFLFYWQRQLQTRFTAGYVLVCVASFSLILLARETVLPGLLTGLVMWTLAWERRIKNTVNIAATVCAGCILLLVAGYIHPDLNIFTLISKQQHLFLILSGNSRIYLPELQPNWQSFMQTLPYAVINGFFQPLPGQGGQLLYSFFTVELLAIWMIVIAALLMVFRNRPAVSLPGFGLFCLALAAIQLLAVGFIVPFVGAIVRYRSIYLPFLLAVPIYYLRNGKAYKMAEQWLNKRVERTN